MTTQTDHEERIRNLETTVTRHDALLPTLATKEDMERLKFQLLTAMAGLLTVAVAVLALLNRFWS